LQVPECLFVSKSLLRPVGSSVIAMFLMSGCSSITIGDPSSFTAITAPAGSLRVTETAQLAVHTQFDGSKLAFYVNGVAGGDSEIGTISSTGLYTAPAIVPIPNSVIITSASVAHPDYPKGSVTLAVWNPIPVIDSLTPSGFPEGDTQVAVTGSRFVYGARVMWNGKPVETTYVSSTHLEAIIPAANPGTYPLLVSNPDPGSANSKTLQVQVAPGQVKLKLQAYNGSDVRVRNTLNLGLEVTGTFNKAVTLTVNGIAGGNSTIGTASSSADGSIAYKAPPVVPTPNNIVTLTATSVDNPSVSVSQNISVLNPIPVLTSATPLTMNPGPPATTIVLTGSDFINGAQVLMNGTAVQTTFNSGTQLTASISPTEPGNLDLQVLNPSPGPATSADLIGTVNGTPPVPLVSPLDAARFLNQATFGATDADIHHLSLIGYQPWLNEQFAVTQTLMTPGVEQALIVNTQPACSSGDVKCNAATFLQNNEGQDFSENAFWQQSLTAPDQLRQRVAYSLHEMLVISMASTGVMNMPRGAAHYYDTLAADAFGNFRQLLEDVTLNPMMGQWLAMQGNDKGNANTDPDENYAREVMQLFTIGLYQLNDDGTQKPDTAGKPIPTYSNTDVIGLARVFTGFSWNVPGNTSDSAWSDCCMYVGPGVGEDLLPMQSYPSHHSTAQKSFLGVTIPSGGTPDPNADLKIALDTLFNHPNLPAFFSKQMIQHLVTSNPSPAYVSRVAAVFKDNGLGVRGDLKAVVTAILTDSEARDTTLAAGNPQFGKVREALLRYTHWARAFTAQSRTGGYWIGSTEDPIWGLGQMALRSPTVFNWFAPGYVPPGTSIEQAGMTGPEFQMTNVSSVVGYLNYMQTAVSSDDTHGFDIFSSYAAEMNIAGNPGALVDRVNLLLMSGQMDSTLYSQILSAVSSIPVPTGDQKAANAALAARVRTAVFLTLASPAYCAQY
jgi:uncharacterized protein (DUF1800 family)